MAGPDRRTSRTQGEATPVPPVGRAPGPGDGSDPGGPLVAVCTGHRCAALRRLAGEPDQLEDLRRAVRESPGAVLVTAGCVGACALGAVAAVAHRDGEAARVGAAVWLTGVQEPDRAAALAAWVRSGGPGPGLDAGLPEPLAGAVAGLGRPPRVVGRGAGRQGR